MVYFWLEFEVQNDAHNQTYILRTGSSLTKKKKKSGTFIFNRVVCKPNCFSIFGYNLYWYFNIVTLLAACSVTKPSKELLDTSSIISSVYLDKQQF